MKIKKIEKVTLKDIDNMVQLSKDEFIPKENKKWWIDNERLHQCFVEYNKKKVAAIENGEPIPFIEDEYICQCILNVVTGMAQNHRFKLYYSNWKSDMMGDAVEAALKYSRAYDPYKKFYDKETGKEKKPNPWGYISMIVQNAFIQRIKKEKDEEYVQKKSFIMYDGFAANDMYADELMAIEMDGTNAFDYYQSYLTDVVEHEAKLEERKHRYTKPKDDDYFINDSDEIDEFFTFE